jgi:hypothetical protein
MRGDGDEVLIGSFWDTRFDLDSKMGVLIWIN